MSGVDTAADVDRVASARPVRRRAAACCGCSTTSGGRRAGKQIRLSGPGGTSTATTDAGGALPLPAGELQLTWQAARPVHALYEHSLADPADRATSTPPAKPLTIPAALTGGTCRCSTPRDWFADRAPQLELASVTCEPDSRLEPLVDGVDVPAVCSTTCGRPPEPAAERTSPGGRSTTSPSTSADPEQTMFADLVRGLTGGATTGRRRFLMDRYLVIPARRADRRRSSGSP